MSASELCTTKRKKEKARQGCTGCGGRHTQQGGWAGSSAGSQPSRLRIVMPDWGRHPHPHLNTQGRGYDVEGAGAGAAAPSQTGVVARKKTNHDENHGGYQGTCPSRWGTAPSFAQKVPSAFFLPTPLAAQCTPVPKMMKRLAVEIRELAKSPTPGCDAGPVGEDLAVRAAGAPLFPNASRRHCGALAATCTSL
jgi:hypothetical protein